MESQTVAADQPFRNQGNRVSKSLRNSHQDGQAAEDHTAAPGDGVLVTFIVSSKNGTIEEHGEEHPDKKAFKDKGQAEKGADMGGGLRGKELGEDTQDK